MDNLILLFDGFCNLCNGFVVFIIKRDTDAKFKFASMQSEEGGKILRDFNLTVNYIKTFVLVENDNYYLGSSAALRIFKNLNGLWPLFYIFIFIPKTIRDYVYDVVAKNRYRWFGKKDKCIVPTQDLKNRFL